MKATFGLEAIGGFSIRTHTGVHEIDDLFDMPYPCWVAEIKGFGKKYHYDREFVPGKNDYSKANSKGTRGIFCWYVLESGHVYEVKEPTSWSRIERYFCRVSDEGEIIKISEGEVEAHCNRAMWEKHHKKKEVESAARTKTHDGD